MAKRPNILFIMSDDHAAHAISAYSGGRINVTPTIDRIANEGARADRCYVTNSICTPSRACILTGTYNHVNGVTTLATHIDNRLPNVAKHLRTSGYQTAMIGKWHLGEGEQHCPTGFDHWCALPGQGAYVNPMMIENGEKKHFEGYCTDIIGDLTVDWLQQRDADQPFFLMCHHKAPHRPWTPPERLKSLYADEDIPEPETLFDDYATRSEAPRAAKMRMEDLKLQEDLKVDAPPPGLSLEEERRWRYQGYIKDYLRCVAAVDENIDKVLTQLEREGTLDDTIVIYTSDQGFFLGDHGWFDKRFMYKESLQMPFVVRYPPGIPAGSVIDEIFTNADFAPTFLDYAGVPVPSYMQGTSCRALFAGEVPANWQQSAYHRYWMHKDGAHNVYAHYGVTTKTHKLIYYYNDPCGQPGANPGGGPPEWELYDLEADPLEIDNLYGQPQVAEVQEALTRELDRIQAAIGDVPEHEPLGVPAAALG